MFEIKEKEKSFKIFKLIMTFPMLIIGFPFAAMYYLGIADGWSDYRWLLKEWFWES